LEDREVDPVAGNGSEPRRTVTSKVVAIIRSFDPGRSLTITEVAQVADLSVSTTHRLVHELAAWGILHRGGDSRYEMVQPLGPSGRRDRPVDLRAVAASTIEDLSAVTTKDVRLGVIDGHQVLYVEKAHGCRPLSDFSAAATLPAHATALGKALLAFAPPETVDHVIRHGLRSYTASTVATAARLRHVLKVTRLRGIAVAKGELLPGHSAVAVPVSGPAGEVAAALEVRLCDVSSEMPTTVPALMIAARGLSRELGRAAGPVSPPGPAGPAGGRDERAMSSAQVAVPRLADRLGRRDRR
jgi:DNA-binding IclR family transcriptional regulator